MTRWEFIKQDFAKVYFVYKDGKAICKIRYANAIVGKVYTVVNSLRDSDGISFSKLNDAKHYIKTNY
jgi:hypothetical protein